MAEKLTRAQFNERYEEVLVRFSSYYKFRFQFVAELEGGRRLVVGVGGDSDDIYRLSVGTDPILVEDLPIDTGDVYEGSTHVETFDASN
jgi:hypothetical protein